MRNGKNGREISAKIRKKRCRSEFRQRKQSRAKQEKNVEFGPAFCRAAGLERTRITCGPDLAAGQRARVSVDFNPYLP
jgi:hypothetical protein